MLEPGDQLGPDFFCEAYIESARTKNGSADYLQVIACDNESVFPDGVDSLKIVAHKGGLAIEATSVYMSETQVDDLIVTLLYWKENH